MKIGIYFKDYKWALNYFDYLIETKSIIVAKKNNFNFFIQCENKDTIQFVRATDNARGYKFDKIYVQEGINKQFYCETIIRSLIHRFNIEEPIQTITQTENNYTFLPADKYYFPVLYKMFLEK